MPPHTSAHRIAERRRHSTYTTDTADYNAVAVPDAADTTDDAHLGGTKLTYVVVGTRPIWIQDAAGASNDVMGAVRDL